MIKSKRIHIILGVIVFLAVSIGFYVSNALFMKTIYLSDWTSKGAATYYFDNGLVLSHPIKRRDTGITINNEKILSQYYVLLPLKIRFIPVKQVKKIRTFAFDTLDVMNQEIPLNITTDCMVTTTFYRHFKRKIHYGEPSGYLGTLISLNTY